MEQNFYTKESHDVGLMDLINLGIVILLSLKNTIAFILIFIFFLGFLNTSEITPKFSSNTRLLIELQNINLKDEQNIDFSSLNIQAIQTEIEKINSNALIHNVIKKNEIQKPNFEITRENS